MQDVVIIDGRARGIIAKNLITGELERFAAHAAVLATGGYGNAYFPVYRNAMGCNCTAAISCYRRVLYSLTRIRSDSPDLYPGTR